MDCLKSVGKGEILYGTVDKKARSRGPASRRVSRSVGGLPEGGKWPTSPSKWSTSRVEWIFRSSTSRTESDDGGRPRSTAIVLHSTWYKVSQLAQNPQGW